MENNIARNITTYRNRKGYTQAEFANILGVTPQAVSKWETGAGTPDINTLPRIAKALGVPIDQLFEEKIILSNAEFQEYFAQTENNYDASEEAVTGTDSTDDYVHDSTDDSTDDSTEDSTESDYTQYTDRLEFTEAIHSLELGLQSKDDFKVVRSLDNKSYLSIDGKSNDKRSVLLSLRDGVLSIHRKNAVGLGSMISNKLSYRLELAADVLDSLSCGLAGSGTVFSEIKSLNTDINFAGSGNVQVVDSGDTKISISGSGDVKTGAVNDFDIKIAGSGNVELLSATGNGNVKITGSGAVHLGESHMHDLSLTVSGSGGFISAASVNDFSYKVSGLGNIKLKEIRGNYSTNRFGGGSVIIG